MLKGQIRPPPVFVNKVLLTHNTATPLHPHSASAALTQQSWSRARDRLAHVAYKVDSGSSLHQFAVPCHRCFRPMLRHPGKYPVHLNAKGGIFRSVGLSYADVDLGFRDGFALRVCNN